MAVEIRTASTTVYNWGVDNKNEKQENSHTCAQGSRATPVHGDNLYEWGSTVQAYRGVKAAPDLVAVKDEKQHLAVAGAWFLSLVNFYVREQLKGTKLWRKSAYRQALYRTNGIWKKKYEIVACTQRRVQLKSTRTTRHHWGNKNRHRPTRHTTRRLSLRGQHPPVHQENVKILFVYFLYFFNTFHTFFYFFTKK